MRLLTAAVLALSTLFAPAMPSEASTTDYVVVMHQYDGVAGLTTMQAHCPADRPVPIGGGFTVGHESSSNYPVTLVESFPQVGNPGLWKVTVYGWDPFQPDLAQTLSVIVWAVCTSGTATTIEE